MTRKLVRVVRNIWTPEVVIGDGGVRFRGGIQAVMTREMNTERTSFTTEGEFFLVDEPDLERLVAVLAEANPGREVQVYNMEQSAECPAAPMVKKNVTKNGVLPL